MRCSFFIAGLRGYFYSEDCVCHQKIFSHSIAFPPIIWLNEYQIFTLLYLFPLVLSTYFFMLDFCRIYSYLLSNLLLLSSGISVTWIGFVTPIKCWKVWELLGMAFGSIKVQWAIFWWLLSPCVTPLPFFCLILFVFLSQRLPCSPGCPQAHRDLSEPPESWDYGVRHSAQADTFFVFWIITNTVNIWYLLVSVLWPLWPICAVGFLLNFPFRNCFVLFDSKFTLFVKLPSVGTQGDWHLKF